MKAIRFLSFSKLLFAVALVALSTTAAMAQFTLPAPTADNEFGRLSWYTNVTNFGGNTSFGVFGQANTRNANGYGFGVYGYGGVNGVYGGAFMSQVIGTNANIGAWALGANATGGTGTYAGRVNIGLEVGANNFAVSGLFGWAIRVDSGDVELGGTGGPLNTTYIHNLVVDGSVTGISGANHFTQNGTGNTVTTASDVNAVVVGEVQGTDIDPAIYGLNAGSGPTFKGNVTGTGELMDLQSAGADVFTVGNTGDLTIGTSKFTVAAGNGKTIISDNSLTGASLFNVTSSAGQTGSAMTIIGGNVTGFASTMSEPTNTAGQGTDFANLVVSGGVPTAGGAAVGITHGMYVDSLRDDQYVDFTGAVIKGLSGSNDYTQTTVGSLVTTSSATNAAIVGNITDAANTDPTILLNNASTNGVAIVANQTAGATLMELQNGGTTVLNVAGTGKTTITDPTTVGGATFNVTNSAGTTGAAAFIKGGNTTGFSSTITEPSSTAGQGTNFLALVVAGGVPTAGGAAAGITHGLYVDSLRDDQYVDFTGATVKGLSGENDFTQTTAGSLVTINSATNAAIVGNITDPTNADPDLLLSNASTAAGGVVIQANQTGGAALMELQDAGSTVFNVAGTGDLAIGAAQNFTVTASNGKTIITTNNLTGASEFNVTSSAGTTGTAMTVTGGNTTGFSSTMTEPSNTAGQGTNFLAMAFSGPNSSTLTAGGAAVGVTHGMFVDSLRDNQYVDFTGATIKGISGANDYTQSTTGASVATSAATNASLIAQTGAGNTDTAFEVYATSGPLVTMQNGPSAAPVTVFSVANGGNTTVTTTSGNTVTAVSTSSSTTDYAVKASGNGASGANALNIDNGGVVVSGGAQPAGNTATSIAAGFRTNTVTITNTLSQPTSYIVVTATGTSGDTYSATVVTQAAGTFNVKVTDVEGNVLADTPVTLSYWIVNH